MSTMTDMWGDKIEFLLGFHDGTVEVVFTCFDEDYPLSMVLDRKRAQQFINELLKAFEEGE